MSMIPRCTIADMFCSKIIKHIQDNYTIACTSTVLMTIVISGKIVFYILNTNVPGKNQTNLLSSKSLLGKSLKDGFAKKNELE